MSPAIADLLVDFAPPARSGRTPGPAASTLTVVTPSFSPTPPPIDIDAIVAEAVARAEIETQERLQRIYEEQAAEDVARHEAELASFRNTVAVELGTKMAAAMQELERRAIEAVTSVAARILARLADDTTQARAIDALASSVRGALGDGETIRIRVTGPQSLFMPFTAAMGDHARHLEFHEADTSDLIVSIDDTLFETRLGEWSSALAGATS